MSISTFTAAPLIAAPIKKVHPPRTMVALRPIVLVTRLATRDEKNPAIYKEDVKAVRT
ncbi:hypothetical protein ACHQM5_005456 [Ranunculus cassubicifolius]